jgi:endo-1,4-beta-xylanase
VFIDGNNGKTASYEDDDQHYSFQDGMCTNCDDSVTYSLSADETAGRLEAAFPLSSEASMGDEVGFDIRITLASQPDDPISWNDLTNSQESSTVNYGVMNLAEAPKITAAIFGTPIIDGEEDEIWANANEEETTTWSVGSSGATAVVRTMWDSEYLYVFAVVSDSLLDKSSINAYEQDSIEVFIDQNNAKTVSYEADDGQYRINYDNEATFNGGASPDLLTSATKITDDGYIVELAIKFDAIVAEEGMIIGFDFQVNNDENADGLRDSAVTWSDPTNQGYQNTSRYGLLVFTR